MSFWRSVQPCLTKLVPLSRVLELALFGCNQSCRQSCDGCYETMAPLLCLLLISCTCTAVLVADAYQFVHAMSFPNFVAAERTSMFIYVILASLQCHVLCLM